MMQTHCETYAGRIWLECYFTGASIELFSFKSEREVERAARGLILLIQGSALLEADI
jgi:hypothetical protein